MNLGQTLIAVDKLDVGEHKKAAIRSYVKFAFHIGVECKYDLDFLCKLSPKVIHHEKFQLGNEL